MPYQLGYIFGVSRGNTRLVQMGKDGAMFFRNMNFSKFNEAEQIMGLGGRLFLPGKNNRLQSLFHREMAHENNVNIPFASI